MPVKPIPDGFNTVTPHLVVNGAADAIEFYRDAFGAEEITRMPGPAGKLMYAEIRIGDSRVMLTDELPEMGKKGPGPEGETAVTVHLYVPDTDAVFDKAVKAGAKVKMPLEDMFWGDRYGVIEDPFGHQWSIAMRKEDLTESQILERAPTQGL